MIAGLVTLALRGILPESVLNRESQLSGVSAGRAQDRTIINGEVSNDIVENFLRSEGKHVGNHRHLKIIPG